MNFLISLLICILITAVPTTAFIKRFLKSGKNIKEYVIFEKNSIICILIIFLACAVRIIGIDRFPFQFMQDEASIGYESYNLLNYGIDRNGMNYPVHFVAWGSGQNALYAYILMPFIKIFGLNVYSVRLPMAIIGCISVLVWFYLLKLNFKNIDKKFLIMFGIFCFFPWHVMKSRWAVESNLFPDIILYAIYFISKFLIKNKKSAMYIASIFIGISSYSYGTSYIFLPIFCIILFTYLLLKKYIDIKTLILSCIIIFIIAFPMILFTVINYFDLETIKIGNITIPKMILSRLKETNVTNISDVIKNIFTNLYIVLFQYDGEKMNYTILTVVIAIFIFICGCFGLTKKTGRNSLDNIMKIWLISSVLMSIFFGVRLVLNVVRVNIFMIPYIYYIGKIFANMHKNIYKIFVVLVIAFFIEYFTFYDYSIRKDNIKRSLLNAMEFTSTIQKDENLYIIDNKIMKEPYIYYLFAYKTDVNYYIENVEKTLEGTDRDEIVNRIGNVYFSGVYDENGIIITTKNEIDKYKYENIKEFGNIAVLY